MSQQTVEATVRTLATMVLVVVAITAAAAYLVFQTPGTEGPPSCDVKKFALTAKQGEFRRASKSIPATQ